MAEQIALFTCVFVIGTFLLLCGILGCLAAMMEVINGIRRDLARDRAAPPVDSTWVALERLNEIKIGGCYTQSEVLALAGEVRVLRRHCANRNLPPAA